MARRCTKTGKRQNTQNNIKQEARAEKKADLAKGGSAPNLSASPKKLQLTNWKENAMDRRKRRKVVEEALLKLQT